MSQTVANFLTKKILKNYAGSRSFDLGCEYFESGCVYGLEEYHGKIVAKVSGTNDYKVRLWIDSDGSLKYNCSCPFAGEGHFCKHCVAVGLTCLSDPPSKNKKSGGKNSETPLDNVRNYLLTREKTELVEMLMHEILDNDALRSQLVLTAARVNPQGIDIQTYRKELDRVFANFENTYGDYGNAQDNAEDLEQAIESIRDLFDDGHYEAVVELCEYGLKLALEAKRYESHSDFAVSGAMTDLQELHLAACESTTPDVEALAALLLEFELTDDGDTFYGAIEKYAGILGKKGLDFYRRRIEEEWAKVPPLKPGDKGTYEGNRYQITSRMASLAEAEDDLEKLIEIKSRDLSSQYRYYEIAETYRKKRKYDQALEWAERGVTDFPALQNIDRRLGEFLAAEYHRRGQSNRTMELIWKHFEENIGISAYENLKEHAEKIKPKSQWPVWREKSLDLIRRKIDDGKAKSAGLRFNRSVDHSLLVEIYLKENLPEKAWEEAKTGGCRDGLWLTLAAVMGKKYPADAIKIYRDRIPSKIKEKYNEAYEQAFAWIKEVKKLMSALGKQTEFEEYLADLRAEHKIKRNFIKLLDSKKW